MTKRRKKRKLKKDAVQVIFGSYDPKHVPPLLREMVRDPSPKPHVVKHYKPPKYVADGHD